MAIPLVLSLQNEGNAIERLYKKGMLTDDMHFRVKELKAFVEQEFQDVQQEAEEFLEGWSAHIWPQAMQFHNLLTKHADEEERTRPARRRVGVGVGGGPSSSRFSSLGSREGEGGEVIIEETMV